MQNLRKTMQLNLKGIQPIKIRNVRVSSRNTARSTACNEKHTNSEFGNSTAVSQKTSSRVGSSHSSARSDLSNFSQGMVANQDPFIGIQEINENPENEEDSLIIELNELLSIKKIPKEPKSSKEISKKPPLVSNSRKELRNIKPQFKRNHLKIMFQ
jgi:hypothetical protein